MRYASIFVTILIVWIAIVVISFMAGTTQTTYDLYKLAIGFTVILFIFGFKSRK